MSMDRLISTLLVRGDVLTADPSAGVEFTYTVSKYTLIKAVSVSLTQGAMQTRWPTLIVTSAAGNIVFQSFCGSAALPTSSTGRFTWAPKLPLQTAGSGANVVSTGPLPDDLYLFPGDTLSSSTVGIGSGSNYGQAVIRLVESD